MTKSPTKPCMSSLHRFAINGKCFKCHNLKKDLIEEARAFIEKFNSSDEELEVVLEEETGNSETAIPAIPADARMGSSARKHYYCTLYANGQVSMTEMLDLTNGLNQRIQKANRQDMNWVEKILANILG